MSGALITTSRIDEICAQRDAALKGYASAAETLAAGFAEAAEANRRARLASSGAVFHLADRSRDDHFGRLFGRNFDAARSLDVARKELDASVWSHLLDATGMRDMMDATEREKLDESLLADVPEVTPDNIRATLERLHVDAGLIFARGLATCFIALDKRFKSHDAFKLGSRIILPNVFDQFGSFNYYARSDSALIDVERVFAVLDGEKPRGRALIDEITASRTRGSDPRQSITETDYFRIRGFMNGNAHLWFKRDDLVEKANKVLAEYYGEVLADAAPVDEPAESVARKAGLPSKDLAFYETPPAVVDRLLDLIGFRTGSRVLEPSAGRGSIAKAAAAKGAEVHAVEIHPARCATLQGLGLASVKRANFLQMPATEAFDFVLMNPPFSGTHWMDHVRHAWGFIRPGGALLAILPASAEVKEDAKHAAFRRWKDKEARGWESRFHALPPESFAASGTRIQTVILRMDKRR